MESPAVFFFAFVYLLGSHRSEPAPVVFLCLWELHYLQRTFFFPLRLSASSKRLPVLVVLLAMSFNLLNGFINARWISELGHYDSTWLVEPRFLIGAAAFGIGLLVNISSDRTLLRLRKPGDAGYHIPTGGLFNWVSCPNYLGEMVEWFGWALATWSWAGLAFAVYTVANLAPRALSHHAWYRKHFPTYPQRRKALLPLVL
ncbi:MAG: methyltransferase [Myxococcaceae bacterium]